ncbi:MAG: ATP-binding protein [Candidatus Nanoarchaeia archaeon]|nr:ATP-binding protein [Candidatus Nanoarchaeia archaeon]
MYSKTIFHKIQELILELNTLSANKPLPHNPQCEKCHGSGKIKITDAEIEKRKEVFKKIGINNTTFSGHDRCDCMNSEYEKYIQLKKDLTYFENISKEINIPEKYQNFCFDMFKLNIPPKVIELLEKGFFVEDGKKKKSFLFWGQKPGTGKTLLALSIMHSLIVDFKLKGRYENTVMLFHELKKYFNMDRKNMFYNEIEYLDKLVRTDILFLDDIGTEKASEWVREKFYYIQEGRNILINKINLFTSNDTPKILCQKIGDKIVSRMMEDCGVIQMEGDDWRIKKS